VKLSGGRLGVRSRTSRGSTFWVELPLGVGLDAVAPSDDDGLECASLASSPRLKALSRAGTMGRNRESLKSVLSLKQQAGTQAAGSRLSLRSATALQGLMDQGMFFPDLSLV
jgi:osomolarity two-component system, sensor histidine kinase SLN1